MRHFTLVPVGGLGNRFFAISSAIAYCQARRVPLTILWFKDWGLNCDYDGLFTLNASLRDVEIRNAAGLDFVLRDNPRRKNLWIPRLFERLLFDKRIYYYEDAFSVQDRDPGRDGSLDAYRDIFLVSCGEYWDALPFEDWIVIDGAILDAARRVRERFAARTIGVHIRRTDNTRTIARSPTSLYIDAISAEVARDPSTRVYLATDSDEEKRRLSGLFGDRIITSPESAHRGSAEGIKAAFAEMLSLAATRKIYCGHSTFAYAAARFGHAPYERLEK